MAGAERQSRLDLDRDLAAAALGAVVRAVDEEAPGMHGLQPFQRARHPVYVGQGFPFDRARHGKAGKNRLHAGLYSVDIVLGVERNLVYVAVLVDLQNGDRQAVLLEGGVECGKDAIGLALAGGDVKPGLGHRDQPFPASRFSLAMAVSALSP